jgi:hypothetical protein
LQYRRKQKDEYILMYLKALGQNLDYWKWKRL